MTKRTPLKILIINIAKELNLKITDLNIKPVASSTLYEARVAYIENEIEKDVSFTLDLAQEEAILAEQIRNSFLLVSVPAEPPVWLVTE